jgi:probable F420-dependent oxidoreductase
LPDGCVVDPMELGKIGVWWSGSWRAASDSSSDTAAELEALGYGALWSSGGFNPGLSNRFERLLSSTKRIVVASGVVNIWRAAPEDIGPAVAELETKFPGRFLLGIGVSHAALIEQYSHPYTRMVEYLDTLDSLRQPVDKERRLLAALGDRMLKLAADRSGGAHPYFVPVEHSARARRMMGQGPLLAPELTVVLEREPTRARELARPFVAGYLGLPNYANNLRSLGFTEDDVADGGSDRLIDAVVAWGGPDAIAQRVHEHHEAGADHVCVQVITEGDAFPIREYRELSSALIER